MNKILFIGCGHMGSAMLKAWSKEINNKFTIIDPITYKKINEISNSKIQAYKSLNEVKNFISFNIIIIAIKPQIVQNVLKDFKKYSFNKKTIFISIVAGKKINYLKNFFSKNQKFVRAMPNMPAMINQGMTGLFANNKITGKDKNIIKKLFSSLGETLWLKKESDLNKVTAISGSGPGYIFLIIDAFEKAAAELKLDSKLYKKMINQTLIGSINLLQTSKITPEDLANKIAIKGGTTEAGLKCFKKNNILHKIFQQAVKAAYLQSKKLEK